MFAVCQIGAESALKSEVARLHPSFAAAFQRPGLVTWRVPSMSPVPPALAVPPAPGPGESPSEPGLELAPIFARAWGTSLGLARSAADVLALARDLLHPHRSGPPGDDALDASDPPPLSPANADPAVATRTRSWRLHVWERDVARPGEEPPGQPLGAGAVALRQELLAATGSLLADPTPLPGDPVLDVITAPDPDEASLVGWHVHGPTHAPDPGGRIAYDVPAEAPSWAFRKLEEGLRTSGFAPHRGEQVVELGAAPGGTSFALVRRGVHVVAVDPRPLAAVVAREAAAHGAILRHVAASFRTLDLDTLPAHVDWLLMDVNRAAPAALHDVRRYVARFRRGLRGVVFTLKLDTWGAADRVPELLARMEGMGLRDARAHHLPSNRQEVCAWARGDA